MFQQITFAVISIELCPLTAQEEHLNLLSNQSRGRQLIMCSTTEKKSVLKKKEAKTINSNIAACSLHIHTRTHTVWANEIMKKKGPKIQEIDATIVIKAWSHLIVDSFVISSLFVCAQMSAWRTNDTKGCNHHYNHILIPSIIISRVYELVTLWHIVQELI